MVCKLIGLDHESKIGLGGLLTLWREKEEKEKQEQEEEGLWGQGLELKSLVDA